MPDTTASSSRRSILGSAAAPPQFTEREPHEHGFSSVFDAEIAPRLAELEGERRRRRRDFLLRLVLVVLIVPAALVGAGYASGVQFLSTISSISTISIMIFAVVLSIAAAFWFVSQPKRGFRDAVRTAVLPPVCRFLGGLEHARGRRAGVDLRRFADAGVVGNFNRGLVDDVFAGSYRDIGFLMVEAKLRRRSEGTRGKGRRRSGSATIFRGLLFSVDVPKPFPGRNVIGRSHGSLGKAFVRYFNKLGELQRVELPHPRFEALFAVYSDNADAVRDWLTPAFLESWVAVAEASQGSAIRAAFVGDEFLAALPSKRDLFETGSLFTPVDRIEEDLHQLLWEVTIVQRLIDFLHGDRPQALA